jgi:hypothetical protein
MSLRPSQDDGLHLQTAMEQRLLEAALPPPPVPEPAVDKQLIQCLEVSRLVSVGASSLLWIFMF